MRLFKLLSVLLDYPSDALLAELRQAVAEAGPGGARDLVLGLDQGQVFSQEERLAIALFLEDLLAQEATDLQARYVQTFDLTADHSLHLTHHIFGEEKTRGPALIDLTEYYKTYGFSMRDERELPDYLPLVLEFVSQLGRDEAAVFLADVAKVMKVLAGNLEEAGSTWAPLVRVIENHGSLTRLAA